MKKQNSFKKRRRLRDSENLPLATLSWSLKDEKFLEFLDLSLKSRPARWYDTKPGALNLTTSRKQVRVNSGRTCQTSINS